MRSQVDMTWTKMPHHHTTSFLFKLWSHKLNIFQIMSQQIYMACEKIKIKINKIIYITYIGFCQQMFLHHSLPPYVHVCILHLYMINQHIYINAHIH
jgi:hypothetical protein